jgi:hypothetical protein
VTSACKTWGGEERREVDTRQGMPSHAAERPQVSCCSLPPGLSSNKQEPGMRGNFALLDREILGRRGAEILIAV